MQLLDDVLWVLLSGCGVNTQWAPSLKELSLGDADVDLSVPGEN